MSHSCYIHEQRSRTERFRGRHGGIVCTSSNASGILDWAYERAGPNGAVLFFPDQHLGRMACPWVSLLERMECLDARSRK